ncbi:ent-kaur-16-ene synthase, chloroplastic-like isoform X1 [Papaver somniferum]|uniref:ent-kaur-16-ene synthase, chloroplastic-like isoform X1 n=1 Tax=Papaver somniferum TaxID=3469 RepID=UPI000E6FADF5|nr:ent-kaur-16-ene synthase, chloroplastic-like isoform X1 [Papaver somniferum]
MFLSHPITNHTLLFKEPKRSPWTTTSSPLQAVLVDSRISASKGASHYVMYPSKPKERIREMFTKVELSVSSYDTAWVAMVPSPNSPSSPCFPKCLSWILENQLPDGSWPVAHNHPLLIKDALSSTLACVLALKKWDIGEEHVNKGLQFIGSKFSLISDKNQHAPIGFDIIFPGMVEYAKFLGLNLPMSTPAIDVLLQHRDLEFKRISESNSEGSKLYLAYIAEGWGKYHDWKDIMKYQRKNGSLFNSPSATAAAFVHLQDSNCLNYLHSLLERFGNAVPTAYPLDIYVSLSMVDNLERLGIDRHFKNEIRILLDRIYICWLHMEEEIFSDMATCALAFRILRMHGYDIPTDALAMFAGENFFETPGGCLKDLCSTLELYRASHILISPDEQILERQHLWSSNFLKQCLSKCLTATDVFDGRIIQEVDYALKFPLYANLERLENKRNLEHYNIDNLRILKSSYRSSNIENKDLLDLAVEDFNLCQSIHQKELQQLERWVIENRLDKLKFARQKLTYCYFSAAATLYFPELSDARMSWARNGVLTTVVDDFFDIGGSGEELVNLIELVEKWDGVSTTDFCSVHVEIIFSAIKNTTNEIGEKAFSRIGHHVTSHIIEIWLKLLNSMMKEAEWTHNEVVPTLEEYMANAYVSFALGPIVLPALYLVGPDIPEEVVRDTEYHNLFKVMSTCGRLLNDIQGFKRESKEGKLNAVSLLMIPCNGVVSEEEAVGRISGMIEINRRELLRLVLQSKDSVVPRPCKDLFWKMSKVVHLFYRNNDGFTSLQEMVSAVNAVIEEPLSIPPSDVC